MSSDNHSDDRSKEKCKYTQPVSCEQIIERIRLGDKRGEEKLRRLQDDWDRREFNKRTDAVRRMVYDLSWYADHDPDKVIEILDGSKLFENWNQGEKEIRMFVETSKVEDPGHYSVYPSEDEQNELDGSSDTEQNEATATPQNLGSISTGIPPTEYEKKSRKLRSNLIN